MLFGRPVRRVKVNQAEREGGNPIFNFRALSKDEQGKLGGVITKQWADDLAQSKEIEKALFNLPVIWNEENVTITHSITINGMALNTILLGIRK